MRYKVPKDRRRDRQHRPAGHKERARQRDAEDEQDVEDGIHERVNY